MQDDQLLEIFLVTIFFVNITSFNYIYLYMGELSSKKYFFSISWKFLTTTQGVLLQILKNKIVHNCM